MIYLPTGEQMRRADLYTIEEIGVPSMVLMERAALEVVRCMEEEQTGFSQGACNLWERATMVEMDMQLPACYT